MFKFLEEFYKEQITEVTFYFPRAQMIYADKDCFGAYDNDSKTAIGFGKETETWAINVDGNLSEPATTLSYLMKPR